MYRINSKPFSYFFSSTIILSNPSENINYIYFQVFLRLLILFPWVPVSLIGKSGAYPSWPQICSDSWLCVHFHIWESPFSCMFSLLKFAPMEMCCGGAEGQSQGRVSSPNTRASRLSTEGRERGCLQLIFLIFNLRAPLAARFHWLWTQNVLSGVSGLIGSLSLCGYWSHLLFDFQEFLKIIPADENLPYFLEPLLIYSPKEFSVILWGLGLKGGWKCWSILRYSSVTYPTLPPSLPTFLSMWEGWKCRKILWALVSFASKWSSSAESSSACA